MSTTLCTGTVKNVISRYMHEGTSVFACFLDASKAFNLVNHMTFNWLIESDFPTHLTRFLLSWYQDQRMCVRWMNSLSDNFPTSIGVRQGGVLSPILFTLYIDDLLGDLQDQGVGCFWDSFFAGAMGYADDIVLLAPSPSALRMMLRCCEDFAFKPGLRFNPSKTQLIRFSRSLSSSCSARFNFCDQQLSFTDTVTHLGHILQYNLSDGDAKLHDMVRKANCLLASFLRVGPLVLTRLFQSYCLSLFGFALWSRSCPALYCIEVAFNRILRKIWHLLSRSHTCIVHSVAKLESLYNLIFCQSTALMSSASKCPSKLVQSVFHHYSSLCYSFCGYNMMFGARHLKQYDPQYRLCAMVISSLRSCPQLGPDQETMIETMSCD